MDSASSTPSAEDIASLVVQRLTATGKLADLAAANLMTIEEETIEQVDQVTRLVMNELLAKQSEQATTPTACPKCGGPMKNKPSQHRALQGKRGKIGFTTEVLHCEACRLDFFPSDEDPAV